MKSCRLREGIVNIENYRNFVTIVDIGTISGAAERLLIAQPALTRQIQQLEEKYGTPLLIRKPRKVELTDAGRILYEKIRSILYLEDAAQKEIDACIMGNRGLLNLGITPSYPDPEINELLLDFHQKYPQITFRIFERNSDQLVELMKTGMIEVALIRSQHFIPAELDPVLSVEESLMAFFHRDNPVLRPEMKTIPLPLIMNLPVSISTGLQSSFSLACENAGFKPDFMNISSSRFLSMLWAGDKKTVAVMVAPGPYDRDEFCCRRFEIDQMDTYRAFTIRRGNRLSAVALTFLAFCRNYKKLDGWTWKEDFLPENGSAGG